MADFSAKGGSALAAARPILSWIVTTFLALIAIGCLSDQLWLALAFLCGACALAIPLKKWREKLEKYGVSADRRRAALAICTLAGFIAIGAFAKVSPKDTARTEKPGESKSATPSAPATAYPAASREEAQNGLISLYRTVLETAKPCDASIGQMGKAASTGNQYATYDVAKAGAAACREAATAIREMEAPTGLSSDAAEATTKAIGDCGGAYLFRQMGMEKAMLVADGDGRPSLVSEMSENLKTGQAGVMVCVADFFVAAEKAGIDPKKMRVGGR